MSRLLRYFLYLLVIAPAVLCGYMIYHQVSLAKEQGAVDELKKHRGNLQSECDSLSGKVKPLEELQSWEDRLKSKEKTLDERIKLAEEMETNTVIRMLIANEQVKSANAEVANLEKTKGALEKIIIEKRSMLEGLIDKISTTNQFLSRLEGRIETLEGQINQKQSEYDNLDKKVRDLTNQRLGLDAKIRDLEKQYKALLEVVNFRISETNELTSLVAEMSTVFRALSDTNATLRVGVANLEERTKDAGARLDLALLAARDACIAETNAILLRAKAEKDLEVVRLNLRKEQAQLEGIKKQFKGLEPSVKELAELEEAKKRLQGEVANLEERTKDARTRLDSSFFAAREACVAETNAILSHAKAEAELDDVRLTLSKEQARLDGIKKKLQGFEPAVKELTELEAVITRRRGELDKIEGDLRVGKTELSKLEYKKEGLTKELEALSESEAKARTDLLATATNFVNTLTTTLDKTQKKKED